MKSKRILVLGHRGQIGHFLEKHFTELNFEVRGLDLLNDPNDDLRIFENPHLIESIKWCDFVYFLAFDVGGSVYLQRNQDAYDFINNNLAIMLNVFRELERSKKPFCFASTQMSNMTGSNYGLLKLIGERITASLKGITVKFWNVYGYETEASKFHVISDFISMAMSKGKIEMKTDGTECRDFLYARDCSEALFQILRNYSHLNPLITYDIAYGKWTSIIEVAHIVAEFTGAIVVPNQSIDSLQNSLRNEPNLNPISEFWSPKVDIKEGIFEIIQLMRDAKF